MPPFDPKEFIRQNQQPAQPAFNPAEYLRAHGREPTPDVPASTDDPMQDIFGGLEARRAAATPFTERAASVAQFYGPMAPIAADAATFGLGNRAIAWGRSLGGEPGDYAKRLAEQNEVMKRWREASPERAVAAELTGGLAGGAGLAKAGITLAKPAAGWIERGIRGLIEGTALGGAQAAGQSYGTAGEKLAAAATAAPISGVFGAGVPLAVSAGRGAKSLFDIYKGNVPQYPPSLLRAVEADRAASGVPGGRVGVEGLPSLGPDAMLTEAGPAMRRQAQAAITAPGPGATALEDALRTREAQTSARLAQARVESFGPDVIPADVERGLTAARRAMSDEWNTAFANAKAVDAEPVAKWLETQIVNRRVGQPELETVRKSLNLRGTNELDPHPRTLHETRMMIDDMLEGRDMPSRTKAALSEARERISQELHDKVPGMANLDARFAETAKRGEAFERGQELFDTGRKQVVRPAEWQAEKAALSLPAGGPRATVAGPSAAPKFSEMGTRAEVERIASAQSNDLRSLLSKFGHDTWPTQNLITQFGIRNVEDFQKALRTNQLFRENYQRIVHNSKTAETAETIADTTRGYFNLPRFSLSGMAELAGDKLAQAQQGFGAGVRDRIAELLATRGVGLEPLRQELLRAAKEQARGDISRTMIENMIRRGTAATAPGITRP